MKQSVFVLVNNNGLMLKKTNYVKYSWSTERENFTDSFGLAKHYKTGPMAQAAYSQMIKYHSYKYTERGLQFPEMEVKELVMELT